MKSDGKSGSTWRPIGRQKKLNLWYLMRSWPATSLSAAQIRKFPPHFPAVQLILMSATRYGEGPANIGQARNSQDNQILTSTKYSNCRGRSCHRRPTRRPAGRPSGISPARNRCCQRWGYNKPSLGPIRRLHGNSLANPSPIKNLKTICH